MAPVVYVTRVETFSAAHRLHAPQLSDEENRDLFGPCNNFHGHGHNYKLEVTVKGPVDPRTGMVINITDLKAIIKDQVFSVFDHKNLDKDVPAFRDTGLVSTTENFAVVVWELLAPHLPPATALHRVRIHETPKNVCDYYGESSAPQ